LFGEKAFKQLAINEVLVNIMRRLRMAFLSLCGLIALFVLMINPLIMLLAMLSLTAFLMVTRQINTYKIVMMLKRLISNASRLRFEIRTRIHMGFRDYSGLAVESEESKLRNSHCGYVR
jgi:hypothetical protein